MSAWPRVSAKRAPLAQVNELAERARTGLAAPGRPLPLRRACEAAGVRVRGGRLDVGGRRHTAMLVPADDGFRATIDWEIWERAKREKWARHRLRFVLAHELGHTLFYRPGRPPTRAVAAGREEENFCHNFANALLVPSGVAASTPLDPENLFALAGRFDVSIQVAAWAFVRARRSTSLLWLRKAPHPARGGEEAMRVEWAASDRFIARGESFKSPLAELTPGQYGKGTERLRLSGRHETVQIEAWRLANAMLAVVEPAESEEPSAGASSSPRLF